MTKVNLHSTSGINNNLFISSVIFVTFLLCQSAAQASNGSPRYVEIAALFKGKAVLIVDGQQQLLREGESGPKGVKLIKASAKKAVVLINGQRRELALGTTIRGDTTEQFSEQSASEVIRAYRDTDGLFRKTGSINGYPVNFLIDTGASSVAISEMTARRLGVNYKLDGLPITVETAAGGRPAYRISINRVTVDSVTLNNIEGVVISGNSPETPLLGMSFLGRFTISHDGQAMVLKKKY